MIAREHYFHTHEQVRDAVSQALDVVNELEIEGDLRVPAFTEAVRLLAAKQVFLDQATMGAPPFAVPHLR